MIDKNDEAALRLALKQARAAGHAAQIDGW
jgi:hypothetical protein